MTITTEDVRLSLINGLRDLAAELEGPLLRDEPEPAPEPVRPEVIITFDDNGEDGRAALVVTGPSDALTTLNDIVLELASMGILV